MARPKSRGNRHLPDYLLFDKASNTYRLKLVTGKRQSVGKDRTVAIAIAREYNHLMRPLQAVSIDALVRESGGLSGESRPLSEYVDRLMARIIRDEKPAKNTEADWKNDASRVKEFFTIPCVDIDLSHVNDYINTYHGEASANVQNRKVLFLKKIFSYAVDESLMFDNPATRKKMKRLDPKRRRRLSFADFQKMAAAADNWLRTAMELAIQTTQARLEVSRILYTLKEPREGACGCVWLPRPQDGIYGTLYIHRQKVKDKEAAHVAIPIGEELKRIIDNSRDNIASPYVVHRLPKKSSNPISKDVSHPTQVAPNYLSRAFSDLRDELGVAADYPPEERPTFHEIRALAAHLFEQQGVNPQARMAHTDEKSTKIYTQNHIQWVEVPHAEIKAAQ